MLPHSKKQVQAKCKLDEQADICYNFRMAADTNSNKKRSVQFRTQLDGATVDTLTRIASEYDKRTAPAVAADIIRTYWPLYEQAEKAKLQILRKQLNSQER